MPLPPRACAQSRRRDLHRHQKPVPFYLPGRDPCRRSMFSSPLNGGCFNERKRSCLCVQKIEYLSMDIKALEILISVVEHKSMAEAARRAGVSPAAIAQRIATLEQELGIKLLSRVGRNVQPTPAGSRIAEKSRGIVRDARALRSMELSGTPVGEMRIGAITTALTGLLPQPLRRLMEMAPDLEIFLLPGASPDLYAQVVAGSLDAAIIVKPPFPLPKTCDWHLLRQEPMVLLKSAQVKENNPHALL